MSDLTDREKQLLQLITAFVSERGYPPTRDELAALTGTRSARVIERRLVQLHAKGKIHRDQTHRGIRVAGIRWKPEPLS